MSSLRRAGLYVRVSSTGQEPATQLLPLRAFAEARGWSTTEYIDHGISGSKDRRPALDQLMAVVRARKVDVVCIVRLDRLARSLRHLVTLAGELEALGVDLVVTEQAIDSTTPAGKLMFGILGALAEFERSLIIDRVRSGIARARALGKPLGRPRTAIDRGRAAELVAGGSSLRKAARAMGVSRSTLARAVPKTPARASR